MTSLVVDLSGLGFAGRKVKVSVTPSTPLSVVRDQACEKEKLDPSRYGLQYKKSKVDLSLPFRLSNLPSNCRLDLVKAAPLKNSNVNVALDVQLLGTAGSQRLVKSYRSDQTLWDVLVGAEDGFGPGALTAATHGDGTYMRPVLTFMNRRAEGALHETTLSSVGLTSGSVLLRLQFEKTETPIEKALPNLLEQTTIAKKKIEEKEKADEERSAKRIQMIEKIAAKKVAKESEAAAKSLQAKMDTSPQGDEVIDRDRKVYRPSESQTDISGIHIPDSFYAFSESDLRGQLAEQAKKAKETGSNAILMTKKMREKLEAQKWAKFKRCIIRVRFPDRTCLQATFGPKEDISNVYAFVRSNLRTEFQSFYLYLTPPIRRLPTDAETLQKLGLVPAALAYIAFDNAQANANTTDSTKILTDEAVQAMEDLPKYEPPIILPSADEPTTSSPLTNGAEDTDKDDEWRRGPQLETSTFPENPHPTASERPKLPKWFRPQ